MKVILLHNVKKIGSQGEVVDVADGYANGFLLPKKLAKVATPEALSALKASLAKSKQQNEEKVREHKKLVDSVAGKSVLISAQASEKDQLFAAIHAKDLVAALQNAHGIMVDEQNITIEQEIKTIGTYPIIISSGDEQGSFTLEVAKK